MHRLMGLLTVSYKPPLICEAEEIIGAGPRAGPASYLPSPLFFNNQ